MEDDDEEPFGEAEVGKPVVEPTEIPALCSVEGISNPCTMRGTVNQVGEIVMVDPGATHNFVSTAKVEN